MITDPRHRYATFLATTESESELRRYDRILGTTRVLPLPVAEEGRRVSVSAQEGEHHLAVIAVDDETGEIDLTLRDAKHPDRIRTAGQFRQENWTFFGDVPLWGTLEQWLLLRSDSVELLRIEDEASRVPLPEIPEALSVAQLQGTRLVVVTAPQTLYVVDPVPGRVVRTVTLKGGGTHPIVRVRGEEVWINDADTMLKLDAVRFSVLDAAGSELEAGSTDAEPLGVITDWGFVRGGELVVIVRQALHDVVVLDALTMHPVGHAVFPQHAALVAATLVGRRTILAKTTEGWLTTARLRKVPLPKP